MGAIVGIAVAPAAAGALTLGITTKSPDRIAARSVTLRADATVSILGASVSWQYGTTTSYSAATSNVLTSLIGIKETVTLSVSGLTPDTTYHVRALATGGLDSAVGRDLTFTTAKEDVTTEVTTPTVPSTTVTTTVSTTAPPSTTVTTTTPGSASDEKSKANSPTSTSDDNPSASDAAGVDPAADVPRGSATAAVTPVLGKTLAIAAVQGTVTATAPTGAPVDLSAAQAVPTGTLIDTRAGTVELTTALDGQGKKKTQTGRFWGGLFEVRQSAADRGLTRIVLRGVDFHACKTSNSSGVAHAAKAPATKKRKKPSRTLWGSDDHGRFQTQGRGSVATVRGTRWMTQDTCDGTLTKVAAGAVAVRDFGADRTVVVRAGRRYVARVAR